MIATAKDSSTVITEKVINNQTSYTYKLIRHEEKEHASFSIDLYEIYVEMLEGENLIFYRTGGIFTSIDKAMRFLAKLKENLATPRNIPYILEDSLSF